MNDRPGISAHSRRLTATVAALIVAASIVVSAAQAKHAPGEFPTYRLQPKTLVTGANSSGFAWRDASVGAAVMFFALAAGATLTVYFASRRRQAELPGDGSLSRG